MRKLWVRTVIVLLLLGPRAPGRAAGPEKDVWTGVARVVAVGDIHGDFEKFVAVLRLAGLVDGHNHWIGGKAHLVQTGDVLDRGPDSRKVMDLLMQLEQEAQRAGGHVHALIGNHEAMNMTGDLRYVSDEEFAAFGDPPRGSPIPRPPLGTYPRHHEAFSAQGKYGSWILGHNAIVKIDGTLFVHGGISPGYARRDLHRLNQDVRQELGDPAGSPASRGGVSGDPEGPLWYRGLAEPGQEAVQRAQLSQVLTGQQAQRMVVGHTVQERGLALRYEERLALIDVGMSRRMLDAPPACLVIEHRPEGERIKVLSAKR